MSRVRISSPAPEQPAGITPPLRRGFPVSGAWRVRPACVRHHLGAIIRMNAGVAQLVEPYLAEVDVARSNLVSRSTRNCPDQSQIRAVFVCAPGRAHSLGGGSPLQARQGELLAERQGCSS